MKQEDKSPAARLAVVDLARGAALIGMAFYHLSWDFAYFHLIPPEIPSTAPMRLYSHAVAAAFLLLAGASLALAHPGAVRWRAYWRRLAIVGGAAALLTAATLFFDPEDAILFGILHCIAAASLLSAPLLLAPPAFAFVASGLAFAAPIFFASPFFNTPALDWIGLETVLPRTLDWRPLLPWAGFVFLGLGAMRLCRPALLASPIAQWSPEGRLARALAWAGRRSLPIYLIHQPILFALLFAATEVTGFSAAWEMEQFSKLCQRECVAGGGEPQTCVRPCQCVIDGLREAGLSRAMGRGAVSDEQRKEYTRIVQFCSVAPGK